MLTAGVTSRRRAIAAIHGDDQVEAVLAEIESDDERASEMQRASLFGAVPTGGGA